MKEGDLVRCIVQGQMGIVLRVVDGQIEVFMGDGLTVDDDLENWEVVPFCDESTIPANFSEFVAAYMRR